MVWKHNIYMISNFNIFESRKPVEIFFYTKSRAFLISLYTNYIIMSLDTVTVNYNIVNFISWNYSGVTGCDII